MPSDLQEDGVMARVCGAGMVVAFMLMLTFAYGAAALIAGVCIIFGTVMFLVGLEVRERPSGDDSSACTASGHAVE